MKKRLFLFLALIALISCQSQTKSYKFAVLCDTRSDGTSNGTSGVNVSAVKAVCKDLAQNQAEFVVAPGDFICGNVKWYPNPPSNDVQLQAFLDAARSQNVGLPNAGFKVTLYPIRGNHECYRDFLPEDSLKASWLRKIGHALPNNGPIDEIGFTFSFTHADALFVALDQYMHSDSTQKKGIQLNQEWLDKELLMHPEVKRVFTFGHTPAFSANHIDCLGEDSLKRNMFLQSIDSKSGVYFCGHDHFYARAKVPVYANDGSIKDYIQQVITPSGAPFMTASRSDNKKWSGKYSNKDVIAESYIDNNVGYQLVTVSGDDVTVEFIGTPDACTYTVDSLGVYHYTFNDDWTKWKFKALDKFTYSLKK